MSTTTVAAQCPKCGKDMWDNTTTKTNPKAPDYKCKDKACDGVIWPPKNGAAPRAAAPAASRTVRQPISDGGPLPYEETGAPPKAAATADPMLWQIAKEYTACLDKAWLIATAAKLDTLGGDTAGAVTAIAATLFIEKNRRARA